MVQSAEFENGLKKKSKKFKSHGRFKSPIFNGASIEVENVSIDMLKSDPAVLNVWPDYRVRRPDDGTSIKILKSKLRKRDVPYWTKIHGPTGVSALHLQNIKGAGAKVAVIDTGVDYTHPALGGCFGAGCKVVNGYDFVGDGEFNT